MSTLRGLAVRARPFSRSFSRGAKKQQPMAVIPMEQDLPFRDMFGLDPGRDLLPPMLMPRLGMLQGLQDWAEPPLAKFHMALDVINEPEALTVKADMPGMNEQEISARIEGRRLLIDGERKGEEDVSHQKRERFYGKIHRSYSLPATVDCSEESLGKVTCNYQNGVLTVKLPKLQGTQGRGHILPIQTGAPEQVPAA